MQIQILLPRPIRRNKTGNFLPSLGECGAGAKPSGECQGNEPGELAVSAAAAPGVLTTPERRAGRIQRHEVFYAPRLFTWPPRLSLKIGGAIFKFNGDYTEATGQGITYSAIAVARERNDIGTQFQRPFSLQRRKLRSFNKGNQVAHCQRAMSGPSLATVPSSAGRTGSPQRSNNGDDERPRSDTLEL